MKNLVAVCVILICVSTGYGSIVTADADGYANGANISGVFTGITLSSVGGYAGLDGIVYAYGDGLASTGTKVFGNNLSFQRQWYVDVTGGFALRADFAEAANFAAIDIIGDDSGDYGLLRAYNSSGVLIGEVTTPQLGYGGIYRAEIYRGGIYDIAYIIAGGATSAADTVHLDNLTANIVPEPATVLLLAIGVTALKRKI